MIFDQHEFDLRCEWGEPGVTTLAPISDAVVIVDVLSFCTSVEIAVRQGALVYPYRGPADAAAAFAASVGAELADRRRTPGRYSLSPESLQKLGPGARLVLPSPNGATLTLAAPPTPVLAGCLRNARAVARAARRFGPRVAVISAGERWRADGSLRPAFEDLVGAGAILCHLEGRLAPEAQAAVAAFRAVEARLSEALRQCSSGKELVERGFGGDVDLAAQLNLSECAPVLTDQAYQWNQTP